MPRSAARAGRLKGTPVAVVHLAFLGVVQYVVSLLHALEFFLGLGIVRVHIRVQFASQVAISPLDILLRRVPFDAQHFVIVFFHRGHCTRPSQTASSGRRTSAGRSSRARTGPAFTRASQWYNRPGRRGQSLPLPFSRKSRTPHGHFHFPVPTGRCRQLPASRPVCRRSQIAGWRPWFSPPRSAGMHPAAEPTAAQRAASLKSGWWTPRQSSPSRSTSSSATRAAAPSRPAATVLEGPFCLPAQRRAETAAWPVHLRDGTGTGIQVACRGLSRSIPGPRTTRKS